MKLALHLSMLCETWKDDVSASLKQLKEAGFDGVEVSLFQAEKETLHKVFQVAQELGLAIICGTGVDNDHDPSSHEPEIQKNGIAYLKSCIDLAKEGNAQFINGVLYAPWQSFSQRDPKIERWKRSCDALRVVGEYALQKDMHMNVEVINRFESDFMNTLQEGSEFLSMLDHRAFSLLADCFHMNIEECNPFEALIKQQKSIGCIHICENHRGVPGSGQMDWKSFFETLHTMNYDGWLVMETFTQAHTEVARGMCIWRDLSEESPLQEAIKGCSYMKQFII